MPRTYRKTRRAERQAETRRRIVDAAIALHQTVGPAAATVTAIAEKAGVSRLTVYRHFPDEVELLRACTGTYNTDHPPPDPSALHAITDPARRLEAALTGLYRYYSDNEAMLGHGADSLPAKPALGVALQPMFEGLEHLTDLLATGWLVDGDQGPADGGHGSLLRGAIAHAVAFPTWRSLRRHQGLTNAQGVELMVGMVLTARRGVRRDGEAGARR